MKTYAPSFTNCFAVARPMPLLPPVTTAIFPSSLPMFVPLELIDTQCASFLDDESEVMGQMLNRAVDHLVHGPVTAIANDSRPLPRFRWRGPQDAADLPPRQVEDSQFLLDVAVMVREGGQHQLRLHSIEYWSLLRQDTLDPMGDIGIGVGQVADDLQHAPSPGDGPRDHLLAANAGNGPPEYPGAGEIGVEQGGLFHLGLPPARLVLIFNIPGVAKARCGRRPVP